MGAGLNLSSCLSSAPSEEVRAAGQPEASSADGANPADAADPSESATDSTQNPAGTAPDAAVDDTPTATFLTEGAEVTVALEVADTTALRTKGLMFRETIETDHGMVFVFSSEAVHPFWMKNTYLPLDMIHVSSGFEVVGVIANAEPQTLSRRSIENPSKYVIEVAGGYAEENGIAVGTRVRFSNVPSEPRD